MRFVENFLGMLEAQVVLSVFIPRQVYHGLQVVDEDRVVGALWVDGFELVQFLIERLGCSLVPFLVLGLFSQFFSLRILLVSPQFLAYVLELLLQEVFSLLFVEVEACFLLDVRLYAQQLQLFVLGFQSDVKTVAEVVFLQHLHLVLYAERHVAADEVGSYHGVGYVVEGIFSLIGHIIAGMYEVGCFLMQCVQQRLEMHVFQVGPLFWQTGYLSFVVRTC